MRTVAAVASRFTWSPAVFEGGKRCKSAFLFADVIGLDFDNANPNEALSLEQALKIFCDVPHVIGTTRNHRRDKKGVVADRFRVILKLAEPCLDARQFEAILRKHVDKHSADESCVDAARQFFPCQIVRVSDVGDPEPLVPLPPEKRESGAVRRAMSGVLTKHAQRLLYTVIPEGERNIAYFKGIKDLAKAGLTDLEIKRLLFQSCPTQKSSPLPEAELERTLRSAVASAERDRL
jgi:hypothetical protein